MEGHGHQPRDTWSTQELEEAGRSLPWGLGGSLALQKPLPLGQRRDKCVLLKPLSVLMHSSGPRTLTPDPTTTCCADSLILPQVSDFLGVGSCSRQFSIKASLTGSWVCGTRRGHATLTNAHCPNNA